jgi:hypothetical protein
MTEQEQIDQLREALRATLRMLRTFNTNSSVTQPFRTECETILRALEET